MLLNISSFHIAENYSLCSVKNHKLICSQNYMLNSLALYTNGK